MEENINENIDSTNDEETTDSEQISEQTLESLKSETEELRAKNRQLFARAKKAEGFELKDNKWIKPEIKEEPKPKLSENQEILDYGQLAFYNSKSDSEKLELDEDIEYLKEQVKETGKSQSYILGSKWFQSELKARKETRVSKNAVPSGSQRSTTTAKDSADYWLDKPFSEVPPEMKGKVVARRMEKEKSGSDFIA